MKAMSHCQIFRHEYNNPADQPHTMQMNATNSITIFVLHSIFDDIENKWCITHLNKIQSLYNCFLLNLLFYNFKIPSSNWWVPISIIDDLVP